MDPLLEILGRAGAGRGLPARLAIVAGALAAGPAVLFGSTCEASTHLAERLGYGPGVIAALGLTFERFDGKGWPGTLRGDAIPLAAQIAMITDDLATLAGLADLSTACAEVARRAGTRYDPVLVRALEPLAAPTLAEFDGADAWAVAESCDPAPEREVGPDRVTETLLVVADFVDIKVPGMAGHSRASVAARHRPAWCVERDLGQNAATEPHRARTDLAHLTDRMLAASPGLAPYGLTAAQHHERLDGSGYPRGLPGDSLSAAGRLLAAADTYVEVGHTGITAASGRVRRCGSGRWCR